MKRWIGILLLAFLLTMAMGCENQPKSTQLPSPTLASNDKLGITGKVELALNKEDNAYVVSFAGTIPDGAFVNFYLLDDAGNLLDFTGDVICRNGKCQASFDADSAVQTARANKAEGMIARVEFYPSEANQPVAIKDKFGSKGAKLAGDNLTTDDTTGQIGVRMESVQIKLP